MRLILLLSVLLLASSVSANLYSARQVAGNNGNTELPGGMDNEVNADDGSPTITPPMMHFKHDVPLLDYPCPTDLSSPTPCVDTIDGTFWEIGTKDIEPNVAWTTASNFDRWSIIYGGWNTEDSLVSNKFMFFDRVSRTWWDRTAEPGNSPGPLYHHCSVIDGHTLYLIGGCINSACDTLSRTSANYQVYWIDLWNLAGGWKRNPMNFAGAVTLNGSPHPLAGRMGFSCFVADIDSTNADTSGAAPFSYYSEGGVAFVGGITNAALANANYQNPVQTAWYLDLSRVKSGAVGNVTVTPPTWDGSGNLDDMWNDSGFNPHDAVLTNDFFCSTYDDCDEVQYWITNLVGYDQNMNVQSVEPGYLAWGGFVCISGGLAFPDTTNCVQMPTNDVFHFTWDDEAPTPRSAWVGAWYLADHNSAFSAYQTPGATLPPSRYPLPREGESVWEFDGVVFRAQGGIGLPAANLTAIYDEYEGPLIFPSTAFGLLDPDLDFDPYCQMDYFHYCQSAVCSEDGFDNAGDFFNYMGKIEEDVTLYNADNFVRWPAGTNLDGFRADI